MSRNKQIGFTLLELMAAMIIIAVIATLGFKGFKKYSNTARRLKAKDTLKVVGIGLDTYLLNHGVYPNCNNYESMVNTESILVKEDLIPTNVPVIDPWGNHYEGNSSSSNGTYQLKCLGDPSDISEYKSIILEPGKMLDASLSHSSFDR